MDHKKAYGVASLTPDELDRLRQYEQQIKAELGEELILVAYNKSGEIVDTVE